MCIGGSVLAYGFKREFTIVLSLFGSHWLAVMYCLVLCGGSCELLHEERIVISIKIDEILMKEKVHMI